MNEWIRRRSCAITVGLAMVLSLTFADRVEAEGTEALFEAQIPIAAGSGFVAAGTGLEVEPGTITFDVPAGSTVRQALLYWSGSEITATSPATTIFVDGAAVVGRPVSDPAYFFSCDCGPGASGDHYYSTYRADVTDLVAPGSNELVVASTIGALRNGAGVIVIYDDGGPLTPVLISDGTDLAYSGFSGDRGETVARTFKLGG
ncbi:MAG: DUF3344 domain-containing protein, partial [Planctomycetes bacterium]|nr:DUF3344 domain-containing protein [Planctomycetota bacterium]